MSIKKRLQKLWDDYMFPLDLFFILVFLFILHMYFDIYKGTVQIRLRKFNELIKKTYQRINQKNNTRDY